jgi:hypothetical protein
MYFWYHTNQRGDLWPVRSAEKPSPNAVPYQVVGEVLEIPEDLRRVPLLELCKRYPPPGL